MKRAERRARDRQDEEERLTRFKDRCALLRGRGYRQKNCTVTVLAANVWGTAVILPFAAAAVLLFIFFTPPRAMFPSFVAADFFLLVLDAWYALGVALFCGVQGLYLARLRTMGAGLWLPLRLGLTAAALLAAALLGLLTPLNALALVYFPELVCNAAAALSLGRRGRMFALGLLLFVGCDVCVGLHNLVGTPVPLSAFAQVGMWLFYLPSQVLIVLSIPKE